MHYYMQSIEDLLNEKYVSRIPHTDELTHKVVVRV